MSVNFKLLCKALSSLQTAREAVEQLNSETPDHLHKTAIRDIVGVQDQLLTATKNRLSDSLVDKENPKNLTDEEIKTIRKGQKIPPIKMVRDRTGCCLMDAKNTVEEWMEKNLGFKTFPEGYPYTK